MGGQNFKELIVWQRAITFADNVHDLLTKFPNSEKFALTNQLQKSSVSVPSNIAEGSQRASKKEFIQFLYIARGSLAEAETQLILAKNRKYVSSMEYEKIFCLIDEINRMSMRLIQSLKA